MSVALGKRNSINADLITPAKRFRNNNSSDNAVIDLVSNAWDNNLDRLTALFRRIDQGILATALRNCGNNLEKAIELIGSMQSTGKAASMAEKVIQDLVEAKSKTEASEIIKSALTTYDNDSQQVISSLAYDNRILKKAFRTLLYKLSRNTNSEHENRQIQDELESEKAENAKLRLKLQVELSTSQEAITPLQHTF